MTNKLIVVLHLSLAISCIYLLTLFLYGMYLSLSIPTDNNVYTKKLYEIKSLTLKTNTEGRFKLGTGKIKGVDYYYVYKKLSKSEIILTKIKAEKVRIIESNKHTPQVTLTYSDKSGYEDYYTIIIPNNTVQYTFNIK